MKVIILAAAVGLASASNILPRAPAAPKDLCCFTLTASADGLGSAIVEEDTIGQNRIYSTYPDGYYCINPAEPGKLYDQGGRTCIISKITQQFQCTQGLTTEVDFTVNAGGDFQADGSDRFLACLAGGDGNNADGSYLIYSNTRPVGYADKCLQINLSTTGNKCAAEAPVEPTYGNPSTTVVAEPTYEKPTIPVYGPETTTTVVAPPKYEQPTIPIYGPETTTSIVTPPKYENSIPVYKPEEPQTTTAYAPEKPVTSIPVYGPETTTTVIAPPKYENSIPVYKPEEPKTTTAYAPEKPVTSIPVYGPETTTTVVAPPKYENSIPVYKPEEPQTTTVYAPEKPVTSIPIYGPETTTTVITPPKYENSVPVYKPEEPQTTTIYAPEKPVTSIPIYGPETTTTVIAPPKYENSVPVYKPEEPQTTTIYAPEKPVTSIPIYGPETTTTVITPPKYENSIPVYKPEEPQTTTVYAPEKPVTSIPIYGPETTTTVIAPPKYENSVPVYVPEGPKTTTVYVPEQPVTSIPIYGPGTLITSTTSAIKPSAPSATPSDALLCPALTLIDGYYCAPALIIPVSPEAPDAAYGTQFVAQITTGNSTLFSFDIPADWEGSTCSLIFTFPAQENTAFPGAWKYAGRDPKIEFNKLNGTIDHYVTYATKPAVEKSYGQTAIVPGGEYRIHTRSCVAGSKCTFEARACDETAIEYFQATGPKAIGLWITRC